MTINEIIIVASILILTLVGVKMIFKRKSKKIVSEYSTEKFAIIHLDNKAKNISDWVHSQCKELDYNFIYTSILQQLEED